MSLDLAHGRDWYDVAAGLLLPIVVVVAADMLSRRQWSKAQNASRDDRNADRDEARSSETRRERVKAYTAAITTLQDVVAAAHTSVTNPNGDTLAAFKDACSVNSHAINEALIVGSAEFGDLADVAIQRLRALMPFVLDVNLHPLDMADASDQRVIVRKAEWIRINNAVLLAQTHMTQRARIEHLGSDAPMPRMFEPPSE